MGKYFTAICLVCVWAIVCAVAFWWYQFRFFIPYSEQHAGSTVIFSAEKITLPPAMQGAARIKVLHFWQPKCFCDEVAKEHLLALLATLPPRQVALYVMGTQAPPPGWINRDFSYLSAEANPALAAMVPSSPSLAVWGGDQQLAYFGPYSVGPLCSLDNSLLPGVFDGLLRGNPVQMTSMVGTGCFCPWS